MFHSQLLPHSLTPKLSVFDYNMNLLLLLTNATCQDLKRRPADMFKVEDLKYALNSQAVILLQEWMNCNLKREVAKNNRKKIICRAYSEPQFENERSDFYVNKFSEPLAFVDSSDIGVPELTSSFVPVTSSSCFDLFRDVESMDTSDDDDDDDECTQEYSRPRTSPNDAIKILEDALVSFGNRIYETIEKKAKEKRKKDIDFTYGDLYHRISSEELENDQTVKTYIASLLERKDKAHINLKLDSLLYGKSPRKFCTPANLCSILFDLSSVPQRLQTLNNRASVCTSVSKKNVLKKSGVNANKHYIERMAKDFMTTVPGMSIDNFKHRVNGQLVYDVMDGILKKMSVHPDHTELPMKGFFLPSIATFFLVLFRSSSLIFMKISLGWTTTWILHFSKTLIQGKQKLLKKL